MTQALAKTENPVSESAALISVIERAASNPNIDVEKMDRLLSMQERIIDRNAKQAYSEAMNAVQKAIQPVIANAKNDQTKSKYATYEALDAILRPIYTDHGFSLTFGTGDGAPDNTVRVICDVMHSAGHEKRHQIDMPADGKGAKGGDVMTKTHATGSAVSYGKRYLLVMIFNVAIRGEDDDGNGAGSAVVTEAQITLLREKLDGISADVPAFCKFMGVSALKDIRQSDLKKAHDAITKKGAKK